MTARRDGSGLVDPSDEPWERLGPNRKDRALVVVEHHVLPDAELELVADIDRFPEGYDRDRVAGLLVGPREGGGLHVVFTGPGHPPTVCVLTEAQAVAFRHSVDRALGSSQPVDLGARHLSNELPWQGLRAKRIDDAGDHILVQCRFLSGDHAEVVLARAEAQRLADTLATA